MQVYQVYRVGEDFSIQGDVDDPFQLSSYSLLTGAAAEQARGILAEYHPDLELRELAEDDIEEPEIVTALNETEMQDARAFVAPQEHGPRA